MKNLLSIRLGQNLSMTPALQQAIRLLQMATVDLQQEIQDALDSNLMLEQDEQEGAEPAAEAPAEQEKPSAEGLSEESIPDQPDEDFEWSDVYTGSSDNLEAQQALYEYRQASLSRGQSLGEHLAEQIKLLGLGDERESICAYLIDALDERGYLAGFSELRSQISEALSCPPQRVDETLGLLQSCEPPGVAARDLAECLQLQLAQEAPGPTRELASRLVSDHLPRLASGDTGALLKVLACSRPELERAVALIRGLQPHPGAPFIDHESQYIKPDLFVRKRAGRWEVHLNPEIAPRIRINRGYQSLLRRGDASPDQKMLKTHLQDARYFMNALRSRNETLLRVATEIIDLQRGFLDYGAEAMKPLVLRDIAERLGLHESTVSRATANKYMHTPRGLVELKYFFSSAVSTTEGGSCSATAIQAMIKRFVAAENPAKPLSDNRLAQMLQDEGIHVARRTIAKYRETMGILPTHERRVRG